jgi:hypothetical protein
MPLGTPGAPKKPALNRPIYGIINQKGSYTYRGGILFEEAHGKGTFQYANGDKYTGECLWGYPDGYGVYTFKSKGRYSGFFSLGKMNGVGTYEDDHNVYKGPFRMNQKHGLFYCTKKSHHRTYHQRWDRGRMITGDPCQYVPPEALQTTRRNPKLTAWRVRRPYAGKGSSCVACVSNPPNATNECGHVVICYDCWSQCDRCPVCRSPKTKIIRLYIS